ncbi:MAG: hypothetical protein JSS45_07655 [Proteobacteria bacterium]|nr:hypothetical protein [Pseudomonadota bacterium]
MKPASKTTRAAWLLAPVVALALVACGPSAKQVEAQRAQAAQDDKEAAANALARNYLQAREAGQYELAQTYGNQLLRDAPDSVAAREVRATIEDTNVKVDEARDRHRLRQLWTYNTEFLEGGGDSNVVHTASILAEKDPNFNGDQVPVKMVLRRHPKWGRSLYLVVDHGTFDCAGKCQVPVQFDDQPPMSMAAEKSDQNRQGLFIDDEEKIRDALDKVRVVTVKTSIDGQPRTLSFEVGGFDRAQLERTLQ